AQSEVTVTNVDDGEDGKEGPKGDTGPEVRNFFAVTNTEQGTLSASTGLPASGTVTNRIRSVEYIRVLGKLYIASAQTPIEIVVYQYKDDYSFINSIGFLTVNESGTIFELSEETAYIKIIARKLDNTEILPEVIEEYLVKFEKGDTV